MITAKFGSKSFEVTSKKIYTPDGLSYSENLNTEETEVSGKKSTVTIKGLGLKSLSFNVKLDSRFVTIATEIKYWEDTMRAGKSENFSLGSTTIGKFFLTGVSVSNVQISKSGVYTQATLTLTFKEDGASTNNQLFPPAKAQTVINSSTSSVANIAKGTKIKPKSGTRWYYTAVGAINRTGKSGKAYNQVMEVTYVYQNGKAINPRGLGWMIPSDVDVVG